MSSSDYILIFAISAALIGLGLFIGWEVATVASVGAVAAGFRAKAKSAVATSKTISQSAHATVEEIAAKISNVDALSEGAAEDASRNRESAWDKNHVSRDRPRA